MFLSQHQVPLVRSPRTLALATAFTAGELHFTVKVTELWALGTDIIGERRINILQSIFAVPGVANVVSVFPSS